MPSVQGYCEAYINDKCRRHKSLFTYSDVKEMYVCIFFKITHSLSPNLWVMRNLTSDLLRAFLPTSTNRVPESYAIQGCSRGKGRGSPLSGLPVTLAHMAFQSLSCHSQGKGICDWAGKCSASVSSLSKVLPPHSSLDPHLVTAVNSLLLGKARKLFTVQPLPTSLSNTSPVIFSHESSIHQGTACSSLGLLCSLRLYSFAFTVPSTWNIFSCPPPHLIQLLFILTLRLTCYLI